MRIQRLRRSRGCPATLRLERDSKHSLFILFFATGSIAGSLKMTWGELAPFIVGQQVDIHTDEEIQLRGEALAVRPNDLSVDVNKTSNSAIPKRQQLVPRISIERLDLRQRTIRWRVVATTAGASLGFISGAAVPVATVAPIFIPAAMAAGHWISRSGDLRIRTIEIVSQTSDGGQQ